MGLVNAVFPVDEIWQAVENWCEELLEKSPGCLEILKASFDQEMDGYSEMGIISSQYYPDWFDMPEGKEGGASFQEKRTPRFWSIRQKEAEAAQSVLDEYNEESGPKSD
jgi:naphthoate synthase/2-ketocyclohexanecarboxyl-CoA hydrolase